MDVTSATSTPVASGTPPAANPKITSDFNTFLRMLTVQMQNQDPMNPLDKATIYGGGERGYTDYPTLA